MSISDVVGQASVLVFWEEVVRSSFLQAPKNEEPNHSSSPSTLLVPCLNGRSQ